MKTIHDMDLIKKIYDNPELTIGQRSEKLFSAYYLGFDMYRQIDNICEIEKSLGKIPSIYDFIEKKYKLSLGSRHWTSPIRYYCEDERELFDETIKHIFEYESKYPFPDNFGVTFSPRKEIDKLEKNKPSIGFPEFQILLGNIGSRPQMYLRQSDLASLRAFLDGYFDFKTQYKLALTEFEKSMLKFIEKYRNKKSTNSKFKTWDRNYRWQWDLAVYGTNDELSIPKFLFDLEAFIKIKINPEIDWSDRESWQK